MPLIKRYPNRKLYDTEAKQYVTLQDLTGMIQEGNDVVVTDHETGEDLTNLTLTQIILEQERKSDAGFVPRALLTGLIRTGGDTLSHVRRSLPKSGNELVEEASQELEEQVNKTVEQGRQMVDQANSLLKLDNRMADLLQLLNVPSTRDLQNLQERIEELNRKLEEVLNSPEIEPDDAASSQSSQSGVTNRSDVDEKRVVANEDNP